MAFDLENCCRLCGEIKQYNMFHISSNNGKDMNLTAKLIRIGLNVSADNNLSKLVCYDCSVELNKTVEFLDRVDSVQLQLRTRLENPLSVQNVILFNESEQFKPAEIGLTDVKVESIDDDLMSECEPSTCNQDERKMKDETKFNLDIIEGIELKDKCFYCNKDFVCRTELIAHMKEHVKNEDNIDSLVNFDEIAVKDIDFNDDDAVGDDDYTNDYSKDEDLPVKDEFDFGKIEADRLDPKKSWLEYPWFCAECEIRCDGIPTLRAHWLQVHGTCCTFACVDCISKKFVNFKMFLRHVKGHRPHLKRHCFVCNGTFDNATKASKHFLQHNFELTCRVCAETFADQERYNHHIENQAKRMHFSKRNQIKKEAECERCGKKFKDNVRLKTHMSIHVENRQRNFSCHMCAKSFYTKGELKQHEEKHKNSFQCDLCDKKFNSKRYLKIHISKHSEIRPYPCDYCGRCYRSVAERHKHIKYSHLAPLKYSCPYCEKKFKHNSNLKTHLRQHTGERPYSCEDCSHRFSNHSNYYKHMKRKHGITIAKPRMSLKPNIDQSMILNTI